MRTATCIDFCSTRLDVECEGKLVNIECASGGETKVSTSSGLSGETSVGICASGRRSG